MRRSPSALAALITLLLTLAACGSGGADPQATAYAPASGDPLTGQLTVFAAASLTEAFADGDHALEAAHPSFHGTFVYAGSQQLVAQVQQGAPADVVATADTTTMQTLVSAGLVDAPVTFAHNSLEIAVAPGNPRGVHALADLARPDLVVVLADPSVPAGRYGRQALEAARVSVTPRSLELSVKSELLKVESGDADAAIVYTSDVRSAGASVEGVVIPDALNVPATYPIAAVHASPRHAAAVAFVHEAVAGVVQAALVARGFLGAA